MITRNYTVNFSDHTLHENIFILPLPIGGFRLMWLVKVVCLNAYYFCKKINPDDTTSSGISDKLRHIYSIWKYCWNVATYNSQWEKWNHLFCRKVCFLTTPHCTFRCVDQGMKQIYLYLWYLTCKCRKRTKCFIIFFLIDNDIIYMYVFPLYKCCFNLFQSVLISVNVQYRFIQSYENEISSPSKRH